MLNDKELLKIVNQIQNSDRIYAVRDIGPEGLVLGGTGCTVTMGLLRTIEEVYVFTPNTGV